MFSLLFLLIAAAAGIGLVSGAFTGRRQRRYLEEGGETRALEIAHLPRPLRSLVLESRSLRMGLEGPRLMLGRAQLDGEALDLELRDSSRSLGEFVQSCRKLRDDMRERLLDSGRHAEVVEQLFADAGFALERGQKGLRERLDRLIEELESLEVALMRSRDPYR